VNETSSTTLVCNRMSAPEPETACFESGYVFRIRELRSTLRVLSTVGSYAVPGCVALPGLEVIDAANETSSTTLVYNRMSPNTYTTHYTLHTTHHTPHTIHHTPHTTHHTPHTTHHTSHTTRFDVSG